MVKSAVLGPPITLNLRSRFMKIPLIRYFRADGMSSGLFLDNFSILLNMLFNVFPIESMSLILEAFFDRVEAQVQDGSNCVIRKSILEPVHISYGFLD